MSRRKRQQASGSFSRLTERVRRLQTSGINADPPRHLPLLVNRLKVRKGVVNFCLSALEFANLPAHNLAKAAGSFGIRGLKPISPTSGGKWLSVALNF